MTGNLGRCGLVTNNSNLEDMIVNLYSVDVRFYATAYIKADSEKEALEIAKTLHMESIELPNGDFGGGMEVSGEDYNSDMPDVSLSPAMTCYGPDDETSAEFVQELDEEDEE